MIVEIPFLLEAGFRKDYWNDIYLKKEMNFSFRPKPVRLNLVYHIKEIGGIGIFTEPSLLRETLESLSLSLCVDDNLIFGVQLGRFMCSSDMSIDKEHVDWFSVPFVIDAKNKLNCVAKLSCSLLDFWDELYRKAIDSSGEVHRSWRSEVYMFIRGHEVVEIGETKLLESEL